MNRLDAIDHTGKPLYRRPAGYTNFQWIQRVAKIMSGFNNLDVSTYPITAEHQKFAERVADDQVQLSKQLFNDMYEHYTPQSTQNFFKVVDEHPGCVGLRYTDEGPVPMYCDELTELNLGTSVSQLNDLNAIDY